MPWNDQLPVCLVAQLVGYVLHLDCRNIVQFRIFILLFRGYARLKKKRISDEAEKHHQLVS